MDVIQQRILTDDGFAGIFKDKTVAVIGNAPTLLRQENGGYIDSFDIVLRFNRYSIDSKYAKNVGTKLDIYACCFWDPASRSYKEVGVNLLLATRPNTPNKWFNKFVTNRDIANALRLGWLNNPEVVVYFPTVQYVDDIGNQVCASPSSGIVGVTLILQLSSVKRLFITGFSGGLSPGHYCPENYTIPDNSPEIHSLRGEAPCLRRYITEADYPVEVDAHMKEALCL
jgi:hypothetical protein